MPTQKLHKNHPQDHDPHPADQGLHFEQILVFWPSRRINEEPESVFAPTATKMQETRNNMPPRLNRKAGIDKIHV